MKNFVSITVTLIIIINLLLPSVLIAGEGPAQPEAAQFEPIDTTDLVSLATGDFNYNVPLLEVLGPEGNWPINMSYHAGIGPNTEATWVGLGWTLNPGSINRFMNGYPDDYWRGNMITETWAKKQKGSGISIGVNYGPVGMSTSFDSDKGFGGVNASMSISGAFALAGMPLSLGPFGVNLSVGTTGLSAGLSLSGTGASGIGASVSAGVSLGFDGKPSTYAGGGLTLGKESPVSLMDVSFSSNSEGASFGIAGVGMQSQSTSNSSGTTIQNSGNFAIPIPWVPGLSLSLGYYEWEWWMDETDYEVAFGCLHQYAVNQDLSLGSIWYDEYNVVDEALLNNPNLSYASALPTSTENVFQNKRMERSIVVSDYGTAYMFSAEDNYQVAAQGISGLFKPYFANSYKVWDEDAEDNKTGLYTREQYLTGLGIEFRFDGDQGGNVASLYDFPFDEDDEFMYDQVSYNDMKGGKKIYPAIDLKTGLILGFKVIATDGKIYEFYQPIYSHYSYNLKRGKNGTQTSENYMRTPYATSWMLTAIKGPDYVDRESTGFDNDDWGFWVKFNYEMEKLLPWRTPYWNGTDPITYSLDAIKDKSDSSSEGLKQKVFLSSIETATHIAQFDKGSRTDLKPTSVVKPVSLAACNWTVQGDEDYEITFPFDIEDIDHYDLSNVDITVYYNGYSYSGYNDQGNEESGDHPQGQTSITKNIDLSSYIDNGSDNVLIYNIVGMPSYTNEPVMKYDNLCNEKITGVTLSFDSNLNQIVTSSAKRLNNILLYNKKDLLTSIEGITFNYDYSLQLGTPNASTGKLTLKSIKKTGYGGALETLPSTKFYYDFNPNWAEHSWDIWGGYSSELKDDVKYHQNSMIKETADRDASAWLLSRIVNSMGSIIEIEYETDVIRDVAGSESGKNQIGYFNPCAYVRGGNLPPNGYANSVIITDHDNDDYNNDYNRFEKLKEIYDDYCLNNNSTSMPASFINGAHCASTIGEIVETDITSMNTVTKEITFSPSVYIDIDDDMKPDGYNMFPVVFLNMPSNPDTRGEDITLVASSPYLAVAPAFSYGGGHRVKSVTLRNGIEHRKTLYKYGNGYTQKLPSMAQTALDPKRTGSYMSVFYTTDEVEETGYLKYQQSLMGFGLSILGPSPSVIYDSVQVLDVDDLDNYIGGRTSYEFWTSNDIQFDDCTNEIWNINDDPTIEYNQIVDRTGKIGRMKKITTEAINPANQEFEVIKVVDFTYSDSDALQSDGKRVYKESFLTDISAPIGMTQQKYITQIDEERENDYIDHIKMNIFQTQTTTTINYYDENYNSTGSMVNTVSNIGYDALSGKSIITSSIDSKGSSRINETIPAYWKYSEMKDKNMLTQKGGQKAYVIPAGEDFFNIREATTDGIDDVNDYLTSATVTTWKDWSDDNQDVYRKNDEFAFVGDPSYFEEFDEWTSTTDPGNFVLNGLWQRTSNIDQYDRYGHPTQEIGINGLYTSALYGYGDALPVAIVTNSEYSNVCYLDFEYDESSFLSANDSKTGVKATKAYDRGWSNSYSISGLASEKTYTVSFWAKKGTAATSLLPRVKITGGGMSDNGVSISSGLVANDQWEYIEGEFSPISNADLTVTIISGGGDGSGDDVYHLVDDIRISPKEASMLTYTYDPLTWKMTSMTDANNITSYYQYDDMGRLVKVLDQDNNILKINEYNYSRGLSQ